MKMWKAVLTNACPAASPAASEAGRLQQVAVGTAARQPAGPEAVAGPATSKTTVRGATVAKAMRNPRG